MHNQKLYEAIADIAYQAGEQNFYTGDSRADVSEFIRWAEQFETENINTDWDSSDYILAIDAFATLKIREASENMVI